ncbi:aldo/keto reductase [Humitalea sp. 24SJ18S-53]|uniref:aldo/keto reductase n=1 Tax=Humitalea sp. 24SJ18S-53 TaxID=3422307 RepID=UPI003D6723E0
MTLNIPRIGLGTWRLLGASGQASVETALELGYRHLDTAEMYGNEEMVGMALAASGVPRDDVFVTSKVWWTNLSPDAMRTCMGMSLRRLGLAQLDLYLIHWPAKGMDLNQALDTLQTLQAEGLTKAIGVANFPPALLEAALATGAPLAALQVEYHAMLGQDRLLAITRAHDMVLTAYSPLAQGRLAADPTLGAIATRLGVTPGQVALAWLMRQDGVVPIPKASRRENLAANLAALDIAPLLTEADLAAIAALPKDKRAVNPVFAPDWNA